MTIGWTSPSFSSRHHAWFPYHVGWSRDTTKEKENSPSFVASTTMAHSSPNSNSDARSSILGPLLRLPTLNLPHLTAQSSSFTLLNSLYRMDYTYEGERRRPGQAFTTHPPSLPFLRWINREIQHTLTFGGSTLVLQAVLIS